MTTMTTTDTNTTKIAIYDGIQSGGGSLWDDRFFFAHGCPERGPGEGIRRYARRVADWAIAQAMASGAYEDESEIELTVRVEDSKESATVLVVD